MLDLLPSSDPVPERTQVYVLGEGIRLGLVRSFWCDLERSPVGLSWCVLVFPRETGVRKLFHRVEEVG